MSSNPFFRFDPSSLQSQKLGSLAASGEEKLLRLKGKPEEAFPPTVFPPRSTSIADNLGGIFKSSVVQEGGIQADIAGEIQNSLGGNADVTREDGLSNPLIADKLVGLPAEVRERGRGLQDQVMQDIAEGKYLNLFKSIPAAAPYTAADSGGSLVAGLAGALATSLASGPVAGLANVLSRGSRLADSLEDVSNRYETIKEIGKTASQASMLVAGDVERQVQDYRAETGESPSAQRLSGMVLGSYITNTAQVGIFKNLVLPKGKESLKEIQSLVRTMKPDSGAVVSIAKRIRDGAIKVGAAGGAEATQEYVQTWQQILSKNVDPKTGQTLADAVWEELNKPENQLEASTGAALGLGAGGFTKGVVTAPGIALGSTVDAAVGTVKTAYSGAAGATNYLLNKSARNKLSEGEKVDLRNQYDNASENVKLKVQDIERQVDLTNAAETLDDLKADAQIAKRVVQLQKEHKLTDEVLQNSAELKEFKKLLNRQADKSQDTLLKALDSSNLGSFKRRSGKPVAQAEAVATEEDLDTLVKSIEEVEPTATGEARTKAARELESKLAVDTVNRAIKDTTVASQRVLEQAKQLSVHDIERVAAIVSTANPVAAKEISKIARSKVGALARFSPDKNRILNNENRDATFQDVVKNGITSKVQMRSVSEAISSAMSKNIKSLEAVKDLQTAIEHYEGAKEFKEQKVKGLIRTATLDNWKKRLAAKAKDFEKVETAKPKKAEPDAKPTENVKKSPSPASVKGITHLVTHHKTLPNLEGVVDGVIGKLAEEGFTTPADFDRLLELIPTIKDVPAIHDRIKAAMGSKVEEVPKGKPEASKKDSDDVQDYDPYEQAEVMFTTTATPEEIKAKYIEQFPNCPVPGK